MTSDSNNKNDSSRPYGPSGPVNLSKPGEAVDLAVDVGVPPDLLESATPRDRRTLALRFLRSNESMSSLLRRCRGSTPASMNAKLTLACVLLMAKDDAPKDLVMTDPALYQVVRKRITGIRLGGWIS